MDSRSVPPPVPEAPAPTPPRNPIDTLRALLAMPPADRIAALASRTPQQREIVAARLKEFDAMSLAERELRLRLLEVHYYLVPLLQSEPAARRHLLTQVPASHRRLLEARLRTWDSLPAEQQKTLLANEDQMRSFQSFGTNTPPPLPPPATASAPSPSQREQLESSLARWRSSPPTQRQRVFAQFQQLSTLDERERAQLLKRLPPTERDQVERSLAAFEKLPPEHRAQWLEAFERFSNLSADERRAFLNSAARWEAMAPAERRAWREVVAEFPPLPTALPPLPSASAPASRRPLATNAQVGLEP